MVKVKEICFLIFLATTGLNGHKITRKLRQHKFQLKKPDVHDELHLEPPFDPDLPSDAVKVDKIIEDGLDGGNEGLSQDQHILPMAEVDGKKVTQLENAIRYQFSKDKPKDGAIIKKGSPDDGVENILEFLKTRLNEEEEMEKTIIENVFAFLRNRLENQERLENLITDASGKAFDPPKALGKTFDFVKTEKLVDGSSVSHGAIDSLKADKVMDAGEKAKERRKHHEQSISLKDLKENDSFELTEQAGSVKEGKKKVLIDFGAKSKEKKENTANVAKEENDIDIIPDEVKDEKNNELSANGGNSEEKVEVTTNEENEERVKNVTADKAKEEEKRELTAERGKEEDDKKDIAYREKGNNSLTIGKPKEREKKESIADEVKEEKKDELIDIEVKEKDEMESTTDGEKEDQKILTTDGAKEKDKKDLAADEVKEEDMEKLTFNGANIKDKKELIADRAIEGDMKGLTDNGAKEQGKKELSKENVKMEHTGDGAKEEGNKDLTADGIKERKYKKYRGHHGQRKHKKHRGNLNSDMSEKNVHSNKDLKAEKVKDGKGRTEANSIVDDYADVEETDSFEEIGSLPLALSVTQNKEDLKHGDKEELLDSNLKVDTLPVEDRVTALVKDRSKGRKKGSKGK